MTYGFNHTSKAFKHNSYDGNLWIFPSLLQNIQYKNKNVDLKKMNL